MKSIKISLALIFLMAAALLVYHMIPANTDEPEKTGTDLIANPNVDSIRSDILDLDSLQGVDLDRLKAKYKAIEHRIGMLGAENVISEDTLVNNALKNTLSKDLFTAYCNRFYTESLQAFEDSFWHEKTLRLINEQADSILGSPYMGQGSTAASNMTTVKDALKKYWEIDSFLKRCDGYNHNDISLTMDFHAGAAPFVDRSKDYLNNGLENIFVENCIDLKKRLEKVRLLFYKKHIAVLKHLIAQEGRTFISYPAQPQFQNQVINPLNTIVDDLDPLQLYGVSGQFWNSDKSDLKQSIKMYRDRACQHFQCGI